MNTLFIIPARAGSKGLPSKNILPVWGKPLIDYTIEQAKAAVKEVGASDRDIWVTSDSPQVAERARVHFVQFDDRPKHLAGDETPIIPVLQHVLNHANRTNIVFERGAVPYDSICLLQPTSPVRPDGLIAGCLSIMEANPDCDSVITVLPTPERYHPTAALKPASSGRVTWYGGHFEYCRRQDLTPVYYRSGQVYLFRAELLHRDEPTIYGERIASNIRTDPNEAINIDSEADLAQFTAYLKSRPQQCSQLANDTSNTPVVATN